MADIIAQLEVLSRESGCLIDLTAILSVCPKIDFKTDRPHKIEDKDDYVCITPTPSPPKCNGGYGGCKDKGHYDGPKGDHKDHKGRGKDKQGLLGLNLLGPAKDSNNLIDISALTNGKRGYENDHHGHKKNDKLLDLDLLSPQDKPGNEGLIDLDVITHDKRNYGYGSGYPSHPHKDHRVHKNDKLLDLDLLSPQDKPGNEGLIDLDVLTHDKRGDYDHDYPSHPHKGYRGHKNDKLLDLDLASKQDKPGNEGLIDLDILTHDKRGDYGHDYPSHPHGGHRGHKNDKLLDLDLASKQDKPGNEGLIDLDILTHDKRGDYGYDHPSHPSKGHKGHRKQGGLLDLDLLSPQDKHDDSLIDLDILTHDKRGNGHRGHKNDKLLDLDLLSPQDKPGNEGAIDLDILTHDKRGNNDKLLDLDLLSPQDKPGNEGLIDLDILTTRPKGSHGSKRCPKGYKLGRGRNGWTTCVKTGY